MPLADARPVAMITTADRKAAEPFYADTLGLRRKGDDGFAALFDLAGVTLRLTEVPGYAASPHPVLGWEVPDIEAAVAALARERRDDERLRRARPGLERASGPPRTEAARSSSSTTPTATASASPRCFEPRIVSPLSGRATNSRRPRPGSAP